MKPDPLAGLSPKQRREYEEQSALYLDRYDPARHVGWFAEVYHVGVVIAERYDLEHELRRENNVFLDCMDCGANLQHHERPDLPALCVVCACHRACADDPDCHCR